MGRRSRQSAKTGDGGAERRLKLKEVQRQEAQKRSQGKAGGGATLTWHGGDSDDHSMADSDENANDLDDSESDESEQEIVDLSDEGGSSEDSTDDEDEDEEANNGEEDDDDDDEDEEANVAKMDKQWGKSREMFYDADDVDSSEEAAQDEEDAALELQRQQAEELDEDDFDDFPANAIGGRGQDKGNDDEEIFEEDAVKGQLADISLLGDDYDLGVEKIEKDLTELTTKEKLRAVKKSSPELVGLAEEMSACLELLRVLIEPALEKFKKLDTPTRINNAQFLEYLKLRQRLLLNYCMNISFYLQLKANGKLIRDHPVFTQLFCIRSHLTELEKLYPNAEEDIISLNEHDLPEPSDATDAPSDDEEADVHLNDGLDDFFGNNINERSVKASKKNRKAGDAAVQSAKRQRTSKSSSREVAEAEAFYASVAGEKNVLKQLRKERYASKEMLVGSDDEVKDDEKRGASFQIMKNRGLTVRKSKLSRNPRVKKRMQYQKALVRRKGQVREVRTGEAGYYAGETTGIKSNITRARKIRN